ncbi:MAG: Spy/CpxP family protein refolding chaperone [Proteobacteria bacterium]|nr:Spy/CpxP family protein refolding chaperone [Pseudomonadota bacterium]
MNTKSIFISGAVGLVAVAAVVATTLSLGSTVSAKGTEASAASGLFGGDHHGWGHGGGRGGRGMAHLCGPARGEKIAHAISFVDNFLTFTSPQQKAWEELAEALRAGDARIGVACEAFKDGKPPQSATAKLAMAESFLAAGLDVVQQVRPAFDRFYATLNDKQRKSLNDLLSRRHRG